MRTAAISVENLCVPCRCRCRYCLLEYRQRFYREQGEGLTNMDDERGHFSVRS